MKPSLLLERRELRYEYKPRENCFQVEDCCHVWCDRGGVERVVVVLLLGALLIILSTVSDIINKIQEFVILKLTLEKTIGALHSTVQRILDV